MARKAKEVPTYVGEVLDAKLAELVSTWRPPALGSLVDWPRHGRVAIDVETCDPHLKRLGPGVRRSGSYLVGVSFAIEGGPSAYLPLRHEGGDNVESVQGALAYLAVQSRRFEGELVGANLSYDLDWLAQEGVDFVEGSCRLRDVQVAAPLLNELHLSYSLDNIAKRYRLGGKEESLLEAAADHFNVHAKKGLWKLPARYVGPYAIGDVMLPLEIMAIQRREIAEQSIGEIFQLECDVQRVLIKMRRRGVLINLERLEEVERYALDEEEKALNAVYAATGIHLGVDNCWKAAALAPILTEAGIPFGITPKTGKPQIDKLTLAVDHPVARSLAWARKVNKLRTTFAASIREHLVNGRIHTTFNQLRNTKDDGDSVGAAYGRLSSEKPNLQQQPARDEFAALWRSIYIPEPGAVWGALDYSQQEPRWTIHYAEVCKLPRAEEAARAYRTNPKTDNHQMMADMANVKRTAAKEIFLGLIYGMGGAKLCTKLGLPTRWAVFYEERDREPSYHAYAWQAKREAAATGGRWFEVAGEEGQALLDKFNYELPFLRKLSRLCRDTAAQRGYIVTAGGRRCRFPVADDGSYDWTHKALNRLIQGTSADQTKRALVEIDRDGHFVQLQVHDEIDGSFAGTGDAKRCAEIMTNCMTAQVPFTVDIEMGPSWGEAKKIEE